MRGERGAFRAALAVVRATAATLCAALAFVTPALLAACSEPAPTASVTASAPLATPSALPSSALPSSFPSSLKDAFRAAHPGGGLPSGLSRDGDASRAVELLAARVAADRILLPGWLPPAYGLASPYIAVGNGAALPNPSVWDSGYRVSYTDGRGLILVHVGAGRLPGEGTWRQLTRTWRGAPVRTRAANGLTTIASRDGALPVAVAVAGVPVETALRVLDSLQR